jgi:hypothetical protein
MDQEKNRPGRHSGGSRNPDDLGAASQPPYLAGIVREIDQ